MSRQWIAFYTGDYLRDTRQLTVEEHGAYLLLLMECWTHGRIPMEPNQQAKLVRVSTYRWKKLWPNLSKFFRENGTNKRAEREVEKADAISMKRSISGRIGGRKSGMARTVARGEATKKSKQLLKQTPKQKRSNCEANHNTSITTTSFVAAREGTEPAEPKQSAEKKPSDLTRAELDQIYAKNRAREQAKANPPPAAGAAP